MEENFNTEFEIDFRSLYKCIIKKWWFVIICIALGVAAFGFYSYTMIDDTYTARSSMIVQVESETQNEITNLNTGTRLVDTYSVFVKSSRVLTTLKTNLNLAYSESQLNDMIHVSSADNTLIIDLKVSSGSAEEATLIANELVSIVHNLAIEYDGLEDVEILDIATIPTSPSGPNRPMYIVMGFILGLIAGVGLIIFSELLDKKIKNEKDVTNKLNLRVLGVIPRYDLPNISDLEKSYKCISKHLPHSPVSEEYRKVRENINFVNVDKDAKLINLSSTFPGEGKTVTAINLATVYAQSGFKTLLIDLDLRRPKTHLSFNISNVEGVGSYVLNEKPIQEYIKPVDENLDFLNSGKSVPFPSEVLSSDKIKTMIKNLSKIYDKIIIDSPPVSPVVDGSIISNFCDGTIYVIKSRHTNYDIAKDSVKKLKLANANVLGVIVTNVNKDDHLYEKEYYHYYGTK